MAIALNIGSMSFYVGIPLLLAFGVSMAALVILAGKATGLSVLVVAATQNSLAGALLLGLSFSMGDRVQYAPRAILYFLVSGLLGIALPHLIVFAFASRLGVGVVSATYLLPPLITYAIAIAVRMEKWNSLRLGGLVFGLVGAGLMLSGANRLGAVAGSSYYWWPIALLAPLSLALGNVFRSYFWPSGFPLLAFSGATLTAAGLSLGLATFAFGGPGVPLGIEDASMQLATMGLVAAVGYLAFFALQQRAGAVYVSQSGYVIATTGIAGGILFYDESLSARTGFGLALLICGLLLGSRRARARKDASPTN